MPAKKKPIPKQITLNEEQQAVVSAKEGFWKVEAGPGAGKSACLVSRFASLIREGVSPDDILSLSFTKTASKNLTNRVTTQVGELTTTRTAGARTFHGCSLAFAQEERDEFPFTLAEFPLAAEPVAYRLASESARRYELDPRSFRPVASLYRRHRICPAEAVRDAEAKSDPKQLKMALAYKDYEKRSRAEGLLDFDSLIYYAVEILSKKPAVRARWVRNWLQLDEAQDMSKIEWDLAKLIAGESVCAVGDISQGIYGFRGSDARLFSEMEEIFPGTQTLYLSCNYRSTPEIVDFIRPIAASQGLAEKFHTQNGHGLAPEIKGFVSPALEAAFVVKCIQEAQNV